MPFQIKVMKFIMQESGTYNPMYQRPYQTHIDGHTVNNIIDRVVESKAPNLVSAIMSGVASPMVSPVTNPIGVIEIPYGWAERRIRFTMEVHVTMPTHHTEIYYFQGYTDYPGVSPTGAIDPNMEFIINSYIRVARSNVTTMTGTMVLDRVIESYHVVDGAVTQKYSASGPQEQFLMRPMDVFSGTQEQFIGGSYSYYNGGNLMDTRTRLSSAPVRSKRSNSVPTAYLSGILNAFQTASAMSDFGQGADDVTALGYQASYEGGIGENYFLRALANIRGQYASTSFTSRDLEQLDPEVSKVTKYTAIGQARLQLHQAGQTAYWQSTDRETVMATLLINAVPALMMDLMISQISFTSTNLDYSGAMNTMISGAKALTNIDLTPSFGVFISRLEREIMHDITYGGQDSYMLTMHADLFGDTSVTLSIGGSPQVTYAAPSFCDALSVPVVTSNVDQFHNVVSDFGTLMNDISAIQNHSRGVNPIF